MKYILIIFLLLSVSLGNSVAQTNKKDIDTVSTLKASKKKPLLSSVPVPLMSESDYYRKLYEQASASENRFVDLSDHVVNYVAILIAILAAAQVLYSFFLSENQIKKVKAEIEIETTRRLNEQNTSVEVLVGQLLSANQIEFRGVINQELAQIRADIERLTIQMSTAPLLVEAMQSLDEKQYLNALQQFLYYAEPRITEKSVDTLTIRSMGRFIYHLPELQKIEYDKIIRLENIIRNWSKFPIEGYWSLSSKPVYSMVQDEKGQSVKKYIRNEPQ